jgi:hypothetical protein
VFFCTGKKRVLLHWQETCSSALARNVFFCTGKKRVLLQETCSSALARNVFFCTGEKRVLSALAGNLQDKLRLFRASCEQFDPRCDPSVRSFSAPPQSDGSSPREPSLCWCQQHCEVLPGSRSALTSSSKQSRAQTSPRIKPATRFTQLHAKSPFHKPSQFPGEVSRATKKKKKKMVRFTMCEGSQQESHEADERVLEIMCSTDAPHYRTWEGIESCNLSTLPATQDLVPRPTWARPQHRVVKTSREPRLLGATNHTWGALGQLTE